VDCLATNGREYLGGAERVRPGPIFVDMNSKPSLTIDTSFVLVGHSNAGDNSGGE